MMKGHFEVYVDEERVGDGSNLLLPGGLSKFGNGNGLRDTCVLGSSRNPNTESTDSVEQPLLVGTRSDEFFYRVDGVEGYSVNHSVIYSFTLTSEVKFSEIGIANVDQSVYLSRALAPDNNGNPAVITVYPDETLKVVHNMRVTLGNSMSSYSFTQQGVDYTVEAKYAATENQTIWRRIESQPEFNEVKLWENFELGAATSQGIGSGNSVTFTPEGNIFDIEEGFEMVVQGDFESSEGNDIQGCYIRLENMDAAWQVKFTPPVPQKDIRDIGIIIGIVL